MHVLQSVRSFLILVPVLQVVRGQAKAQSQGQPAVAHSSGVPGINATFDYVIVGGGTAGLTIASRLAAEPSISVAVVEAGGYYEADDGNVSVVPGYCTRYAGTDPTDTNPLVDWGFETVAQTVSRSWMLIMVVVLPLNENLGSRQQTPSLCSWQDLGGIFREKLFVLS